MSKLLQVGTYANMVENRKSDSKGTDIQSIDQRDDTFSDDLILGVQFGQQLVRDVE